MAELGQAPNVHEVPTPVQPQEPDKPETPEVENTPEVPNTPEIPEVEDEKEQPVPLEETNVPHATKKKCSWIWWTILAIILACIIGGGVYFHETITQWWQCMQECQSIVTEDVVDEQVNGQEIVEDIVEEPVVIRLADQPREYVNFLGLEKVGQDSRLAWIAYKYYAQKDLWVFIYEANRDIISHPTLVRPGQYIRIPDLEEKYRNLYDPELKQLVDSLAIEYLKK